MENELPIGWIETDFESIILRVSNGANLEQKDVYFKDSYPISRIETIAQETIDLERVKYVEVNEDIIDKYCLKPGDILFSHINSDKHLGKTAYFDINTPVIHGINLLLIRCNELYSSKLLHFLFKYYRLKGKFIEVAQRSVNQSSINQKKLKEFPIPLPPIAEQKRIVDKLDTLFGHLDTIKSSWINFESVVDSFVESAIVDTSTGNYFKVEKLKNYLVEGTERIGNNWKDKRKVGISAKDGIIELATGQKETFEKYKIVNPGDFVYNAMRVNIGSIGIYEGKDIAITSPDYVVFRVKNKISPKLLLRFLKSQRGLLEIGTNTQGSVRSRLYFKYLVNINYPVAPEKIQNLAEKFLSCVFKASEKWKNQIEPNLDNLRQALLAKAFRGELVAQLPTDGDARDLLEQIKRAKEGLEKGEKGRKMKMEDEVNLAAEPRGRYGK